MKRVLVTGSRDLTIPDKLFDEIMSAFCDEDTVLITGCADGIDKCVREYAKRNYMVLEVYTADWTKFGRSAGPIRNKRMLEEGKPSVVVAFPGRRGTQNMINLAYKAGVPVHYVKGV